MDETNVTTADSAGAEMPNAGKTFTQSEFEQALKDRLDRQKRSIEAAQAKERETAEQAKLAEQQQFKALAAKHEARVKELEPLQGKVERLEAAITKRLEQERKGLPKPILALLDKMDAAEQLDWIVENKAELIKSPAPNINGGEKGNGIPSKEERVEALKQQALQSGKYGRY